MEDAAGTGAPWKAQFLRQALAGERLAHDRRPAQHDLGLVQAAPAQNPPRDLTEKLGGVPGAAAASAIYHDPSLTDRAGAVIHG